MSDPSIPEDPPDAYLSFLSQVDGWESHGPEARVNVYEILRDGHKESRVDLTLLYFLDPTERHGLGSVVIDALLQLLHGTAEHTVEGSQGLFDARAAVGSSDWEIETQAEYIDVLAVNSELGLAIVLENKINAPLDNLLESYKERALERDGVGVVLVAVLAPEVRHADHLHNFSFASLTYDDLIDSIRRAPALLDVALAPADLNQRRSVDLLQQFLEARAGRGAMEHLRNQMERIERIRESEALYGEGRRRYDRERRETHRLLKERRDQVRLLVTDLLFDRAGLLVREDYEPLQSPNEVRGERGGRLEWGDAFFLCAFWPGRDRDGARIEIKFSMGPGDETIFLQHYWGKWTKRTEVSRGALNVDWSTSDKEIAEVYVDKLLEVKAQYDRGELGRD